MKLDEALTLAVQGERVRGDHMQPGCYVEHTFSRGFLRCWPVDKPELEPMRDQCDFRADKHDEAADWSILERPKFDSWGKPLHHGTPTLEDKAAAVGLDLSAFEPDTLAGCGPAVSSPWVTPAPKRDDWGRPIG